MKYYYYFFAICLLSACCTNEEPDQSNLQEYDQEFQLKLDESVFFTDGNSFKVVEIVDEFCCCLCYCIWEGELRIQVETSNQEDEVENIQLGSSTLIASDNCIFEGYTVSKIDYLYDGQPDVLPLCKQGFDPSKVELTFVISSK